MRKGILLTIGALVFLTGCGNQGNKASSTAAQPKKPVFPYTLSFDAPPAKPNPAGITIPAVKFTANPNYVERRASLAVWFDASAAKTDQAILNQLTLAPFDISGTEGTLPADTINSADQGLARMAGAYCLKGKIKVRVALVRSSISPGAGEDEVNEKRLSDWLPIELDFKNPHPKC